MRATKIHAVKYNALERIGATGASTVDMGDLLAENLKMLHGNVKQQVVQTAVMVIEIGRRDFDFPGKATYRKVFEPFGFKYPDGRNAQVFGDVSFMIAS
ncbi:hypothetical protein AA15973_2455 [Komagataeibacter sucrofermentans DSM 15973]|nr:hypothetical protein AA15973_2455 [Komagataeibacter sucrofermentans DSM 15973]